jgi:hypothetical protein
MPCGESSTAAKGFDETAAFFQAAFDDLIGVAAMLVDSKARAVH